MRRYLGNLKRFATFCLKVNWYKSLYINFKMLPFKLAWKLPIICFGRVNLLSLTGRIIINGELRTGIVQIGKDIDNMPISHLPVKIKINNNIVFNGRCIISGGASLEVCQSGYLELGKYSRICSGVFIKAFKSIKIGDFTWITAESIVMDSDVHYIKDIKSGKVKKNVAPIIIGSYCWINMRSKISKGSILPNYTIVASNSFINKDFTNEEENGLFLGGSPAKIIATGIQYIPYRKREGEINKMFSENEYADCISLNMGFEEYINLEHPDFNIY